MPTAVHERPNTSAVIPPAEDRVTLGRVLARFRIWAVLIAGVVAWDLLVRVFQMKRFILPSPGLVLDRVLQSPELVVRSFLITAGEAGAGFLIAATVGILLAMLIAKYAIVEELVYPYLNVIRVTPIIAIAPLLIIWFGHGATPHIIVATMISFFPIVVTTVLGLRSVDPDLLSLMRTLNANDGMTFRKIRLPNALPYIFSAFRISAPLSVIGALVGEFAGGDTGMGNVLITSRSTLDTSMVFAMVALSGLLGIIFFGLVVAAERRLIRWHPSVQLE